MTDVAYQQCINPDCAANFSVRDVKIACDWCGALLDVRYDWNRIRVPRSLAAFEPRAGSRDPLDFSGVWRFRELLPFYDRPDDIVTIGEGRTILQTADLLARELGMRDGKLLLQYEGFNPSASFKDNGMTAAFTHARMSGAKRVACASTGNTSASLALYASFAQVQGIVFIGSGKIALGKLSQALDHGALTLQIKGDFDACMRRVKQVAEDSRAGVYLMNSVNPFRLEGQKSIMYRILEMRGWEPPDWIIVPGGNLGNSSAFGKAFAELRELGLIARIPRLAIINACGANTLNELYTNRNLRWNGGRYDSTVVQKLYSAMDEANYHAQTVASAIEISRPVNLSKALRSLEVMNGVVREVSDEQILEHRAMVARYGFGCEPASAASVAGLRALQDEQVISPDETVACVLTGHELKDPNATVQYHTGLNLKDVPDSARQTEPGGKLANKPIAVDDDLESIFRAIQSAHGN